jgi:hypothetical protein
MKFKKTTFIAVAAFFCIFMLFSLDECTNIFMEQILKPGAKPVVPGIFSVAQETYPDPLQPHRAVIISDAEDIVPYLESQAEGGSPDNPVILRLKLDLGDMLRDGSAWRKLLRDIDEEGEYVSLDLSECTMSGTMFNLDGNVITGKDKIVTITLPDTATSIPNGSSAHPSFDYFTNLASFSGAGLSSIGNYAFFNCASLTQSSLPDGLVSIGNCAFEGCTNLALDSLPAGLRSIGFSAFSQCTNLALTSLPDGLCSIGRSAFSDCTSLALTSLPSGLSSIELMVFSGCTNLTHIFLPERLSSIGYAAFQDCTSLVQITSLGSTPPALGTSVFSGTHTNLSIKVPAANVNEYKIAWSEYANRIFAE